VRGACLYCSKLSDLIRLEPPTCSSCGPDVDAVLTVMAKLLVALPPGMLASVQAQVEGGRDMVDVLLLLADYHLSDYATRCDILDFMECDDEPEDADEEVLALCRRIRAKHPRKERECSPFNRKPENN
jgi:hypothetical protein